MFLKPNQMYLESQGLYQKVCRLAQVRVQLKALQVEADNLEQQIYDAMCPATELVDVLYLRTQTSDLARANCPCSRWNCSRNLSMKRS